MNDMKPTFLTEEQWRVHLDWLEKEKAEAERLKPYDFAAWDSDQVPEQEWTLADKIPRRQVCLFSGEGAAGKSTIGLHLCAAHALGRDCLQSIAAQGPAFFIDAEDETSVIHRRLAAVKDHYGVTFSELARGGLNLFPLAGKDPLLAAPAKGGVILPTNLYNQILKLAVELKPQTIVVASSANVYAGSEIDRPQVTQFINLLTRLAIASNGSVVLISHPSLTGITTETGLSGSTQWHNAVRARLVIKTVKQDDDDANLRLLECKKNQYGPPSSSITLAYQNGMFLPKGQPSTFDRLAKEAAADNAFLKFGAALANAGRILSPHPSKNYAPAILAELAELETAKIDKRALEQAMTRLTLAGKIRILETGSPSKRRTQIEFA